MNPRLTPPGTINFFAAFNPADGIVISSIHCRHRAFELKKFLNHLTGFYLSARVDAAGDGVVSQAGGVVLTEMVKSSGLAAGLSKALAPWRKPFAIHNPGKILTDLALSLATSGDFVSDIDRLRNQPDVYGHVASDPTISRLFTTFSRVSPGKAKVLAAINTARAAARAHVWARSCPKGTGPGGRS